MSSESVRDQPALRVTMCLNRGRLSTSVLRPGTLVSYKSNMASTFVQSSPAALNRFFRDISSKFSPGESEDVVKSSKRIYGEQFNSVDNQDLLSCLNLLYKLGYVSNTKLTLVKEFVATKSNKEKDINDTIDNFKESLPPQADPEKELQGRIDDFKNITEKLEAGQPSVVNLFGSAGVGKTTLAKEICEKWRGKDYVFDLREAKDMRAVYVNILNTLKLSVPVGLKSMMNYAVGKIHEHIGQENVGKRVLFLLDNVEQFTAGKGKEGKNLKTGFMMFLGTLSQLDDNSKVKGLSILLTSRTQLHDVKNVSDYELEPLKDSFSEKILFSMETSDLNTKQKEKLLCACKGKPLLLKGMEAILMQGRKAPSDLVDELEKLMASKEKAADIPVQSKSTEDAKEKAFDLEKEGVDEDETSVIEEMFNTLSSDSLKAAAVSISLFCGPFSASTAAKILDISQSEAVAQLEGLVTSAIIFVVNREAKELMYDIHPLLRKYACSIKDDAKFTESYTRAKKRFYDHFMSKMKTIAGSIEPNYVEAFNLFADDRPNYDFAIEISLQPEFFSVPANFHDIALIESVFSALLSNEKQLELFHSWAKMCEEDTKSGNIA